jgi:hypothetical protein
MKNGTSPHDQNIILMPCMTNETGDVNTVVTDGSIPCDVSSTKPSISFESVDDENSDVIIGVITPTEKRIITMVANIDTSLVNINHRLYYP